MASLTTTNIANTAFKWLNKLSAWLLFAAIIWFCWALAQLLWLFLAPPVTPALTEVPKQNQVVNQSNYRNTLSFFENKPVAPPLPAKNISLKGVLTAVPSSKSSAMIQVDKQVKNYRINQQIEGTNYKLISVDWNEAVLQNAAGAQQIVKLHETMELDQGFNLKSKGVSKPPVTHNIPPPVAPIPSASNGSNNVNSGTPNKIDEAVQQLKTDPAGYLSKMGVMATGDSYEVTDAMPDNVRSRLGLKPGDQVLSINGKTVGGNPSQDADILTQIKDSGTASIRIKRDEKVITIRQQF